MKMLFWIIPCLLFFAACEKDHLSPAVIHPADTLKPPVRSYNFELIWRKPMDTNPKGFISPEPMLSGGNVGIVKMFGGPDNVLTMRDGETGEVIWTFSDPADIEDGSEISAAVAEEDKIILSAGNQLYVLHASDGKLYWKYDLNQFANACAFPRFRVYNRFIYHGHTECNFPGQKFASFVRCPLNTARWDTLFNLKRENGFSPFLEACNFWIHPSGDTMIVFLNRQPGKSKNKVDLYSLNLRSREIAWKIENLDPSGYANAVAPLIWEDKIYIQGFYTVYCIDALSGAIRWNWAGDTFYDQLTSCNMVIVDDKLVLRSNYGYTIALDPDNGDKLWRTELVGSSGNMIEYKGVVYFSGHKGYITAIDGKTGEKLAVYQSPNLGKWGDAGFICEISIDPVTGYLYTSDGYETFCLKTIR